jgi:hypothetical protein
MSSSGSKKTFYFPPVCARCGKQPHTTEKKISRTTSYRSGNIEYRTTYTINIPLCQPCRGQHGANVAAVTFLTFLLIGVLCFVGWVINDEMLLGPSTFIITLVAGIVLGIIGLVVFRKLFNIAFAWIIGDGAGLGFSNAEYQRLFNEFQTNRTTALPPELEQLLERLRNGGTL